MSQKVNVLPIGVSKVRFSFRNHLMPPIIGITAMLLMYVALNFQAISAQAGYYFYQPVSSATVNAASVAPSNKSEIIIPSINVKAPIVYEPSTNNATIAYALRNGVVHYGTTALPGEKGNVAIFGHSSGLAWAPGNYKFVFTLLDKLKSGQQISLDYKGVRYVYIVTGKEVVAPTDMKALDSNGKDSQLLLITCTPVGTSDNRLIVHAKQVRPDPADNRPFRQANTATQGSLPGN